MKTIYEVHLFHLSLLLQTHVVTQKPLIMLIFQMLCLDMVLSFQLSKRSAISVQFLVMTAVTQQM